MHVNTPFWKLGGPPPAKVHYALPDNEATGFCRDLLPACDNVFPHLLASQWD